MESHTIYYTLKTLESVKLSKNINIFFNENYAKCKVCQIFNEGLQLQLTLDHTHVDWLAFKMFLFVFHLLWTITIVKNIKLTFNSSCCFHCFNNLEILSVLFGWFFRYIREIKVRSFWFGISTCCNFACIKLQVFWGASSSTGGCIISIVGIRDLSLCDATLKTSKW